MKILNTIAIFASVLLVSTVSATAQETAATAGVVPVKASVTASAASTAPRPLTDTYRVGVGDILDIRLAGNNNRSTLFTVAESGLIDLPVAGGTIAVDGLTAEEIQNVIATELKRRAVEEPAQVSVSVRQYLSHTVTVTGLVIHPGTRFLRREQMPLYVILAESQLRNDGGRVVIMRNGMPGEPHDLNDPATLNLNVQSGDIITVSTRPEEFYYIGGRVNYPGQKQFQSGITLLQAILAAGGTSHQETKVEISREGEGGRLVTISYNLKQIKSGTVQDPKLTAGDRIEVAK